MSRDRNRGCWLGKEYGRRSGKSKRQFNSYAEAVAFIGDQPGMNPYRCTICYAWHVGHPGRKLREQLQHRLGRRHA